MCEKSKIFKQFCQNTLFNFKCTLCKKKTSSAVTFNRFREHVSFSVIEYFRICEDCFLHLTFADIQNIFLQIGSENYFMKSTCSYCGNKCTEYLRVDKGLGKKLCVNCLAKMTDHNETNDNDFLVDDENYFVVIEGEQEVEDKKIEKVLTKIHKEFLSSPYESGLYRETIDTIDYYPVSMSNSNTSNQIQELLEDNNIESIIMTEKEFDEYSQIYSVIITKKQSKTDEEIEEIINGMEKSLNIQKTKKGTFREEMDRNSYFLFSEFSTCDAAEECLTGLKSLGIKAKILNDKEWEKLNNK